MNWVTRLPLPSLGPWLISAALLVTGFIVNSQPAETPAEACGMPPNPPVPADALEITIMARTDHRDCWHVQMAVAAAPLVTDYTLGVTTMPLMMNHGPSWAVMVDATQHGRAADIMVVSGDAWKALRAQGALVPLDACVTSHPEFANIRPDAWYGLRSFDHAHVWAVPLAADTGILFFSKPLLRRLGWSEAQIDALPQRVLAGNFSQGDMRALAREAERRGIVRPGFGVWQGEDNNWTASVPRRDARVSGRVLFWDWGNRAWGEYLMKLGKPYDLRRLYDTIGYALLPAEHSGLDRVVTHAGTATFYVLTSDKANGNRHRQQQACALLAKMMTPEINDRHIAHAGFLSVLTTQASGMPEARFGHDIMRMIDGVYDQSHSTPDRRALDT